MIADSVAERDHGKAFGYHRAMDHAGASLGPVIAFALLAYGLTLERVILLSAVPGLLVLLIVWLGLRKTPLERKATESVFHWSKLSPDFKRLVAAAGGVSFAAVPDVLLILWVFRSGIHVAWVPLLWAIANVGRMGSVAISGMLSDRYGRKTIMISGWGVRVVMLVVLALVPGSPTWAWPLFLVYTAVTAWTESVERAWLSDLAPSGKRATVFGAFHMVTGLAVLPGAILIGSLWEVFDMKTAFLASAFLTAISAAYLFRAAGRLKTGEAISDSD